MFNVLILGVLSVNIQILARFTEAEEVRQRRRKCANETVSQTARKLSFTSFCHVRLYRYKRILAWKVFFYVN